AAGNITTQASPVGNTVSKLAVSASGKLESQSGNISAGGAESITVDGSLLASTGSISVISTADTIVGSTGQLNAQAAISITAGTDLQVDGNLGGQTAPLSLTLQADSGTISVNPGTGRLSSARSALIDGQTVHFDGVL
ncbi:MAG: hypothetical protein ACKPJD_31155, partial [Planctomycetaceae bacterium]